MKKLLSLLVAAVLLPVAANADVLNNVKLIGEVQAIASDVKHNYDMDVPVGDIYNPGAKTRVLAGLSFDVVEDVTANVLFQYVYNWGNNNYTNNGFDNAKGMRLANANLVFTNLFDALEVTVGRQFYGEDGSPIIYFGPNHYNAEGRGYASSLDAVKVVYANDTWTGTLIAGKVADITSGHEIGWEYPKDGLRSNLFGADLKLNVTDALMANLYGYDFTHPYWYSEDEPGNPWVEGDQHVGVYGAKLSWTTDAFRVGAEYARNFRGDRLLKEHKDTPYMVKADIAADINAVTARGTFLYAKSLKDNGMPFFQMGDYGPGLIIGHRLTTDLYQSIFSYDTTGIRMFNVGLDYKPTEKWTVSLDGFSYQSRDGHRTTYEADLTAKYAYNENVELFAGFGYAKYGNNVVSVLSTTTYARVIGSENYKGQLGMLVKF